MNDAASSGPRPRKHLTLQEKIELLTYYKEVKCSVRKLSKIFNIGKTQAGRIIKDEDALMKHWQYDSPYSSCKLRPGSCGFEIDRLVFDWYWEKKQENNIVSGVMIQRKAREFAKEKKFKQFKASNGWLSKFLKRHGISFCSSNNKEEKSESNLNMNETTILPNCNEWESDLAQLLHEYEVDEIFCVVQAGLFYRACPEDTRLLYGETSSSGKLESERCTLLFCVGMSGTKEELLVITNNVSKVEAAKLGKAHIHCVSEKKSWITQNTMTMWLKDMDFKFSGKRMLLFMDYAVPRSSILLKNIKTVYFPPYFSTENQPVRQRVVQDFKILYRQQLINYLIELKDKQESGILPKGKTTLKMKTIEVPQAIKWITSAWKELDESTIRKGFVELGFESHVRRASHHYDTNDTTASSLDDISNLLCALDSHVNAADYVSIDNDVMAWDNFESVEVLVDADDVKIMLRESEEEMAIAESPSKEEMWSPEPPSEKKITNYTEPPEEEEMTNTESPNEKECGIVSYSEALSSLKTLGHFYSRYNDSTGIALINRLIAHNENIIASMEVENSSSNASAKSELPIACKNIKGELEIEKLHSPELM